MPADEWLSTLLEYTRDKIAVIDESGEYVYVNRASGDILGYEPEALVGETVFEYVHEDDVDAVRRRLERLVEADDQRSETMRYRHRTAAGGWTWLESRVSSIEVDAAGTVDASASPNSNANANASGTVPDAAREGYVVSARDISDQVVAERERQQARQRLETITRTASDVLWLFSADWDEVLFVNPAYEDVFGRPIDELERDPTAFLKAVHPDDVSKARNAMERLTAGESVDIEYRVNPNGDAGRWVWVKGEPVVTDGEVTRVAGFTRDITDRRRRERQLTVMDTLLRHNLRNELCLILGHAELIADAAVSDEADGSDDTDEPTETGEPSEPSETDEPDEPSETDAEHGTDGRDRPETSERAEIIHQHGERLLESAEKQRRIIDLLTEYPVPEPIDLVDVVSDVVERTAARHSVAVETDLPESATAMTIDEIGAALRELLENAIEHAPDGRPNLSVSVGSATDDTVAVTIEDDCPPIPELEFRVLTGDWEMTDVYHTSGLGLWLVYWTVDISDGRIEFSHDEAGNTITILLPDAAGG